MRRRTRTAMATSVASTRVAPEFEAVSAKVISIESGRRSIERDAIRKARIRNRRIIRLIAGAKAAVGQ